MPLSIESDCSLFEYRQRFARIGVTTLLQDAPYGLAIARTQALNVRWLVIRDGDDELGTAQILEKHALGGAIGVVMLDRGPLWFPGTEGEARMADFLAAFAKRWPRRFGRRRRIVPEWSRSAAHGRALTEAGFRAVDADAAGWPREAYETHLLDLDADPTQQRARMLPRWRSGLQRAEGHVAAGRLRFEWPRPASVIADLLQRHVAHRERAGFRGMEAAQLGRLLVDYAKADRLLVGYAHEHGGDGSGPCSAIAVLCHEGTATYQLAWNDDSGRTLCANSGLLWAAMERLRARGVRHLDLGGHNSHTPGLQRYKAGMGGRTVQLMGMYD